jgi:uncharacterized membrane protein
MKTGINRILAFLLTFTLTPPLTGTLIFANDIEIKENTTNYYVHIWGGINIPHHQENVWIQLLDSFAMMRDVPSESEEAFLLNNQAWVNEVGAKLESFMDGISLAL